MIPRGVMECAGTVYRARELHSRTIVVLKAMRKEAIKEASATYQIRHEIEIHSRLKHPNIVSLYSYFQNEDNRTCTAVAPSIVEPHAGSALLPPRHARARSHACPCMAQCFW